MWENKRTEESMVYNMTATLSFASKSCLCMAFSFKCAAKSGQEGPHCPISCHSFFICLGPIPIFPTSHCQPPPSLILHVFTFVQLPSSICPSIHPRTASCHYCASLSALSDSQNCNATPLTWASQQSAVIVGETCLEAAMLSFSESEWAPWKSRKPERELCQWSDKIQFISEVWTSVTNLCPPVRGHAEAASKKWLKVTKKLLLCQ